MWIYKALFYWLSSEYSSYSNLTKIINFVSFQNSSSRNETNGQEIYMYDIGTKAVNRLKGELSSAFVNVAEANANAQEDEDSPVSLSDSGIYEKMPTMSSDQEKITIIQAQSATNPHERSSNVEDSNTPFNHRSHYAESKISISSGYSVIKR